MKKIRALVGVFHDNTLIDGEYVSLLKVMCTLIT